MSGRDELGGERRDHGPVVGAQPQRRDAQGDPRGSASLDGRIPQPTIGDDSTTEEETRNAEVAARGERLGEQHVDDRLAEARRDIRDGNRLSRGLRRLHVAGDGR